MGEENAPPMPVGCPRAPGGSCSWCRRRPAVCIRRAPLCCVRDESRCLYYMPRPGHTDIGDALRILRARAGLTQQELAARAQLDGPHLSRLETGQLDIRWSTLNRLLAALGADLRDLQDTIERIDSEDPSGS